MSDKKKNNKKSNKANIEDIAKTLQQNTTTDPMGSYTGNPNNFEKPVQDADDL